MIQNSSLTGTPTADSRLEPFGWLSSTLLMVLIGSLLYIAYQFLIPAILERTGQPYLVAYLIVWGTSMALVLLAALVLYASERRPRTWQAFADRYRLSRMPGKDWLWTLAVLFVTAGFYFGLTRTANWLASIPIFAPVPLAPVELRPDAAANAVANQLPGIFFDMPVQGQWWVTAVYFAGWICNILGEEFFYRGWMLPRQEQAFGRYAWLVNGTMFTFQHWMQPYNFLAIWPGALFMAWVVQRRRNTWIGILQHGLMNFSAMVILVRWVIG